PDPASGVVVRDLLPVGLTLLSASPSRGTYNSTTGLWTVGAVDPSAAQTLTLTARVDSPDPRTNTATLSRSDQFDPDGTNNTASAGETPQQADLVVTKVVNDSTPNVGDAVVFTVTVANAGPDAATGVRLTDLLPAGLALLASAPSQGTYTGATGLWDVGTLASGSEATLQLQARGVSPAPQLTRASVNHSDQFDPDPANNSAAVTETPQQADLQVSKTVSDPTPNVGDTITYTITLTNNGPDDATGVVVQDVLSSRVRFRSSRLARGGYDP